jgi:hypothetical protein
MKGLRKTTKCIIWNNNRTRQQYDKNQGLFSLGCDGGGALYLCQSCVQNWLWRCVISMSVLCTELTVEVRYIYVSPVYRTDCGGALYLCQSRVQNWLWRCVISLLDTRRCLPRAVVADVQFGVSTGWVVIMWVATPNEVCVAPNQLKHTNIHQCVLCTADKCVILLLHTGLGKAALWFCLLHWSAMRSLV